MALARAWKRMSWFYYQYLLVTALYMLEPWERTVFSILRAAGRARARVRIARPGGGAPRPGAGIAAPELGQRGSCGAGARAPSWEAGTVTGSGRIAGGVDAFDL